MARNLGTFERCLCGRKEDATNATWMRRSVLYSGRGTARHQSGIGA